MKKILLIEDDKIMRENTAELLQLTGYETEVAKNGKEGIKKAKTFFPNLIICDIMMPELDGYSVLQLLSKDVKTASIPFIFLTAKSEMTDLRRGMNMGADDFLTKPFQDIELLNAIESRIKKHEDIKNKYHNTDQDEELPLEYLWEKYPAQYYKAKELLYRDGEYGHYLYLINKGQVKTYRLSEDGKKYITGILQPGDFFGHKPLLEERSYHEFAETMEESELYKIPKDDFISLINKNVKAAETFIKMISKDLSEKEEELLQLAYSSVKRRVARKLKEMTAESADNHTTISRVDLAQLVGTSNETLVRMLTELKDDNIIDTAGSKITILDLEKLDEIVKIS